MCRKHSAAADERQGRFPGRAQVSAVLADTIIMENGLTIFARRPLDRSMRSYNELMLIMPSGAFAGIDGAHIAHDGYIEFVCEFCQDGPIVATMREAPEGILIRSLTSGAHVAIGE